MTMVTEPHDRPSIVAHAVAIRRGGVEVLRGVSFECGPGLHALLGANGSGKSSLLRALAGIIPVATGSITISGHDLWSAPVEARRRLGYMPESPELFAYLTPRELLTTVGAVRGAGTEAGIDRFVAWVGEAALDLRIGMLSAGQRRKLALSAACAAEPAVLLLDEPGNTLDAEALADLRDMLAQWRASGRCVVVAIHHPETLGVTFDTRLLVAEHTVRQLD